jgi:2-octaprenyl-6-methoxyphenol hydroxylase
MEVEDDRCDVLVVGGGLVGSALALALSHLPLRIVLAESHNVAALEQPGFDARATALASATRRILENLGVWDRIARRAEPITRIHISERGRFGASRIDAEGEGVSALGYTIENRDLGTALWTAAQAGTNLEVLAPARFLGSEQRADAIEARIATDRGEQRICASVLVAADGARSAVRESLGIGVREDDYLHSAVIFNCLPRQPLGGLAIERFTADGPLALLPLPQRRGGVIWSVPAQQADELLALEDAALARRLENALGGRLGAIERIGERAVFPLRRIRAGAVTAPRVVLIGSAAVNLHPVAGQGFNLAMRDVAWLAEAFADELYARACGGDVGAAPVLEGYARSRRRDHASIAALTHGLVRLFEPGLPGSGAARGLGLVLFDLLPGARRALASLAMGRSGKAPRLVCGQSLYSGAPARAAADQ